MIKFLIMEIDISKIKNDLNKIQSIIQNIDDNMELLNKYKIEITLKIKS